MKRLGTEQHVRTANTQREPHLCYKTSYCLLWKKGGCWQTSRLGRKVGSVLDHELKGFVTPKEDVDTAVWIRGKARSEEPAWGGREFEATGQVGL